MKIKRGDNVAIIAGKQKGAKGRVVEAFPRVGRVLVEGINLKKQHQKARRRNEKGQIVEVAHPIDVSNVMLVDPQSGKTTRVAYRMEGERKVRIARTSGAII